MARKTSLHAALQRPVNPDGTFSTDFQRLLNEIISKSRVNTGNAQAITIASGIISLGSNFSYFVLDTESAAASDDLDTISNGNEGDLIFIKAANSARTVVIKDGTGNILTNGSVDLSLDNTQDLVLCHFDGTNWKADIWNIGA